MREAIGNWMRRATHLSVCLLALVAWTGTVSADKRARAEELNAEGKKLVKQLDLEGAADRFRRAMQLADDPRYAFNLCYTLEKTRNFEEAHSACKRVTRSEDSRLAGKAKQLLITIEKKIAEQAPPPPKPEPTPVRPPEPAPPRPRPEPGPAVPPKPAVQPTRPASQPIPPPYARPAPAPYLQQNFQPQQRTRSYRTQVILADVASLGFVAAGTGSESAGLLTLGVVGMLVGGPIVHTFQSNSRSAYLSSGARVGLPLAGLLLFAGSCDDEFDCFEGMATGAVLGFTGALVLDWFVFSKKTEWVTAPVKPTVSLTPDRSGAIAGLRFSL